MSRAESTRFSSIVEQFWSAPLRSGRVVIESPSLTVVLDASVPQSRRVTLLERDGNAIAVISREVAERLDLSTDAIDSVPAFRHAVARAGITLHGADAIFYFSESEASRVAAASPDPAVRLLTEADRDAFEAFESAISEQDRDDAWVELDHWAVVGRFVAGELVCAASAYPWGESRLADLGVLTLPARRGSGHARAVVRELARLALERDFEPQYRCQLDNVASLPLARSAGLTRFGDWDVVSPESTDSTD